MKRAEVIANHKNELFCEGFRAAGYEVCNIANPGPGDVILAWNRKDYFEEKLRFFERSGARVLIAENGYIGTDARGHKLYAVAEGHHLGRGKWNIGEYPRWQDQNIRIWPWRRGGKVVVLAQRSIGERGIAMPRTWTDDVCARLRALTDRPILVRPHPGKDWHLKKPLEADLDGAHCVVTWASGAAIKAMAWGIPCFHELPGWIGEPVSKFGLDIENPHYGDREALFHKVAYAQWTIEEIAGGKFL